MIYVGQNAVKFRVDTDIDLTTVSSSQIYLRYYAPNTSSGEYAATVETSTDGIVYYNMQSSETLSTGLYRMWAHVTHADGRVSIGEPFSFTVKAEGSLT